MPRGRRGNWRASRRPTAGRAAAKARPARAIRNARGAIHATRRASARTTQASTNSAIDHGSPPANRRSAPTRPADIAGSRQQSPAGSSARMVRAQRSSCTPQRLQRGLRHRRRRHGRPPAQPQAPARGQPAQHVVVREVVRQRLEAADPLQRRRRRPSSHQAVLPAEHAGQKRTGQEAVGDLRRPQPRREPAVSAGSPV